MSDRLDNNNKSDIRKTALILGGIAVMFYLGFILLGVLRA